VTAAPSTTSIEVSAEPENAWAGQGAVMLDIGGDIGALVVTMPESTVGTEVEIRPLDGQVVPGAHHHHHDDHDGDGAHEHLAHVAVVARPVAGGHVASLVFPELETGRYELFEKGQPDQVALRVDVPGGGVTTAEWPR
jgi:hypothetical protein